MDSSAGRTYLKMRACVLGLALRYPQLAAIAVVLLSSTQASPQAAARWDGLYGPEALRAASQLYSKNIRDTWTEDFLKRLPPQERQALGNVSLQLPPVGEHKHPFDYYARPSRREVFLPIQSVKFLDDLAIAQAWLLNRNCSDEAVLDYVGFLRFGKLQAMPGGRLPTPSAALGVPDNALKNAWVNDVSGKALKSTAYFLMVHEAGHVLHAHRPYDEISAEQAQAQEMQADKFALDVMERIGLTPQALAFFFTATSWFEPMPSDFTSDNEYRAYRREVATHPLSADRLMAIAGRMEARAGEFAKSEPNRQKAEQIVRSAGTTIRKIGQDLNDPKVREYQKFRGQRVDLQVLRSACP